MIDVIPITSVRQGRGQSSAEVWRTVPGSKGYYSVSNLGRVRSEPINHCRVGRQRGRVLKCYRDTKGYAQFGLCVPGRRRQMMKVHRAVALAFIGPRPQGAQTNHISGNKKDNSAQNLEYVSCRQNIRHAWALGLRRAEQTRGERQGNSKLTCDQVRMIRAEHGRITATELARRFGVTSQCIAFVQKGKTWKHVV